MKGNCIQCGRYSERIKKGLCEKHYSQLRTHGKCLDNNPRTKYDLNEIITYDDYAEIIIYDKYCNEKCRALIDIDDIDKVKNYKWRYSGRYILSTVNSKPLRLHRLVMNCNNEEKVIDHINGNTLDNRKSNLRICTQHENDMNHKISCTNKSGTTGVRFREDKNKWVAYIYFNKKNINLGSFDKKEDAIKCRLDAEKYYFGEFSSQKSRKGEDNNGL